MELTLRPIEVNDYKNQRNDLMLLVEKIWTRKESYENIKDSIERWGNSKTESGEYFYILQDNDIIGITGYFIPNIENGVFGLRHHGATIKGTGKIALDVLIDYLKLKYGSSIKYLIELIPEGKEELILKFEEWGFTKSTEGIPSWEPKKDYYKYVMIKPC